MKKLYLILCPLIFSGASLFEPATRPIQEVIKLEPKQVQPIEVEVETPDLNNLVNAMIYVESRGNDSAVGDRHIKGGEAVGALQIRPIMVREVNRILKIQKSEKRFDLADRYDREKTIEMFSVWKNYHHPDGGFEEIARTWNGGPRGHKNKRTEKYWIKVQQQLNS